MKPWLQEQAEEFAGKVKFVSIDLDKSPKVVEVFQVEAPPTLVLMRGNEEVARVEGAFKSEIVSMIKEAL